MTIADKFPPNIPAYPMVIGFVASLHTTILALAQSCPLMIRKTSTLTLCITWPENPKRSTILIVKLNRVLLLSILLIGLFWRFYNYPSRWVLNQDQARDGIIALYSFRHLQLPLLGPTSSSGPYNFGALYYWLVIPVTFLFPFAAGSWVAFTLISTLTILIFYLIGKNLANHHLGLILALLAAISPSQVFYSTDMLNTVITAPTGALALLFTIKYIKTSQLRFALLQGLFIGLAQNFHFQALGLFALFLTTFIFQKTSLTQRVKYTFLAGLGWLFTFLPNLYFDLTHHFAWTQSIINYYTTGVNKFYVPIRWLTDIRDFWPQLFGQVVTGFSYLGYLLIPLFLFSLPKSKRPILTITATFIIEIFLLRYYKGTRSPEYLIFLHPIIILLAGYGLFCLSKYPKIFILTSIIISATFFNIKNISQYSQAPKIFQLKQSLDRQFSGKISLYSYPNSHMASLPVTYLLYRESRLSQDGTPVGIQIVDQDYQIIPLPDPKISDLLTPQKIYSWIYINYRF